MNNSVEDRLIALERAYDSLHIMLKANTDLTKQIQHDTSQLITLFKGSKMVVGSIIAFGGAVSGLVWLWHWIIEHIHA